MKLRAKIKNAALKALNTVMPDHISAFLTGQDMGLLGLLAKAGVKVTEDEAIKVMSVFACLRLISSHVGSISLHLYKRKGRGKERADEDRLYDILRWQANPEMSAFDFKRVMQKYVELYGNAYAEVQRDRRGRVAGLWPIPPWLASKKRDTESRKLYYEILTPDGPVILRHDQVFHLRGIGNGLAGFRPVELAKNAIGLAMATEEFGSKFFSQGATMSGIAEYPGKLSEQALKDFKASFSEAYAGLGNAHRILFLEQGLKFHEMTVPNEASQFMETRSFQALEVCRFFGVPPHKIGILDRATFSNIEHQAIEYVQDCIEPRCVQWEQEIRRVLLQPSEQQNRFAKFNLSTLLRGDVKSRGVYYNFMRQNGILSANDIRELEDLNPIPVDQGGDLYLMNGNMIPMTGADEKEGGVE